MTHTYEVTGPVALLMTTTAAELDDELANRLLVLAVDEGRAQTRAVQAAQRDAETLQGLVVRTQEERSDRHPTPPRSGCWPPSPSSTPTPRCSASATGPPGTAVSNAKYLGLIRAVALAHQHQRPRRQVEVEGRTVTYIEATAARRRCGRAALCPPCSAPPSTSWPRPPDASWLATKDFADGRHGAALHPPRAAGGDWDGRHPDEGAPGPLGRPRVRGRQPGRAGHHLRAGPALHGLRRNWAIGRVENGDRSGPAGDRSAIGRFSSRNDTSQLSEATGEASDYDERSVGIGRGPSSYDQTLFSQLDDVNPEVEPDRSGFSELRVVGDNGFRRARRCMSPRRPVPKRPPRKSVAIPGDPTDPYGFHRAVVDWLEWLTAHDYSPVTVLDRSWYLATFISWAELRGIFRPRDVTFPVLESYQRHVGPAEKIGRDAARLVDPGQVPRPRAVLLRLVHQDPAHPLQPRLRAGDAPS